MLFMPKRNEIKLHFQLWEMGFAELVCLLMTSYPVLPRETEGSRQEGISEEWHCGKSCQSATQEECQDKVTTSIAFLSHCYVDRSSPKCYTVPFISITGKNYRDRLKCKTWPLCVLLLKALIAASLLGTPSNLLMLQPNTAGAQQHILEKRN